jgi:DNA-binding transcriptional ArsR family regulator
MHSKIGGVTNSKEDNPLARLRQKSVSQTETDEVLMKFFKGLGESTRLRIVEALLEKERNVSELLGLIGVPQSNISNHLACLKWCGYITSRKEGTSVFYRITDERVRKIVNLAREIIADNAEHLYACTRIKD